MLFPRESIVIISMIMDLYVSPMPIGCSVVANDWNQM